MAVPDELNEQVAELRYIGSKADDAQQAGSAEPEECLGSMQAAVSA